MTSCRPASSSRMPNPCCLLARAVCRPLWAERWRSSISATDLNFPYDLPVNTRFLSIAETHLFSPTLVNDFRFGYVRINNSLINIAARGCNCGRCGHRSAHQQHHSVDLQVHSGQFRISDRPDSAGRSVSEPEQLQLCGDPELGEGQAHVPLRRRIHSRQLDKLFPQVFNGQLFFVNTPGVAPPRKRRRRYCRRYRRPHGFSEGPVRRGRFQLRRRWRLQPPIPQQQLLLLCSG